MAIGRLGPWSLPAARKQAKELRVNVDQGIDPLAERRSERQAMSVQDLWVWYSSGALKKLSRSSRRDRLSAWERHIAPALGPKTKLKNLSRSNIQSMVDRITERAGPTAANRCHSYVRKMLNLALAEGFIDKNPAASSIERNQEHPRQVYLTEKQLGRLLASIDDDAANLSELAIKLLILTGARKSEVLSMRWDHIDIEQGVWTKPAAATKQRREHRVPLSAAGSALVQTIAQRDLAGPFVFPGAGREGHLTEVRKTWTRLCSAVGVTNVRLHDIRHSYASFLISRGRSLEEIGALLGHSQAQTTLRYAHLYDEAMRSATEQMGRLAMR